MLKHHEAVNRVEALQLSVRQAEENFRIMNNRFLNQLAILTGNYFWRYINYEITNDAFIDQYIAPVNIRVAGYIQDVRFKEHQYVKQGDTQVILDNHEYLIRQKETQAALLDAQGSREVLSSGIQTSHTRIAEQEANLAEAKAKLWQAEQDFHSYERLLQEESVPQQQYDVAKANFEAAKAR